MPKAHSFGPDPDKIRQLAKLLRKANTGTLNSIELTTLVDEAAGTARSRNYRDMCAAAEVQGVELDEMAVTAVGEMFAQCHGPLAFTRDLVDCIDCDTDLVVRFWAISATKAANFLYHDLEHSDRNGFNLTRNLKAAIRTNPCIHQWPEKHPQFVSLAAVDGLNLDGVGWTFEDICRFIWETGQVGDSSGDWLEKVLDLVVADRSHVHFVEKSMLLKAFREVSREMIESELVKGLKAAGPESDVMRKARALIDRVRPLAHLVLDRQVKKGRSVKAERECLGLALDDHLDDVRETGGPGQSRHDYVKDHWPDLTTDLYKRRFKSPFQTALTFVHQYIMRGLRGELG
ncbi:MAG: hypothetical protein WAU88_01050 [Candidatus Zixiibacteriota bacterium]